MAIFGFEQINPYPYATNVLRIRRNDHAITELQSEGEYHTLDRMLTAIMVERWGENVVPLAEGLLGKEQLIAIRHLAPYSAFVPRNYPLLFATRWGRGKAVQFTLNARVWRNAFYGHARGLDDLFWRSIAWATRKPFVANMIPPFVTMSIDDCSGRHDFEYVDIANEHGYTPSLFLKNVPERLLPKIRAGLESGKAHYNTHALDYYHLLAAGGGGEPGGGEAVYRGPGHEGTEIPPLGAGV